MRCIFTACNEVIFSQVSVILTTGGVCLVPGGGGGGLVPGGCLFSGGAWSQGGCLVPGEGVPGPGGGWCLVPGGCLVETPPGTATAAGGTHPTGMHSCLKGIFKNRKDQERLSQPFPIVVDVMCQWAAIRLWISTNKPFSLNANHSD